MNTCTIFPIFSGPSQPRHRAEHPGSSGGGRGRLSARCHPRRRRTQGPQESNDRCHILPLQSGKTATGSRQIWGNCWNVGGSEDGGLGVRVEGGGVGVSNWNMCALFGASCIKCTIWFCVYPLIGQCTCTSHLFSMCPNSHPRSAPGWSKSGSSCLAQRFEVISDDALTLTF